MVLLAPLVGASAAASGRALLLDTSEQPAGSPWTGARLPDAVPAVRAALERRGFGDVEVRAGADATLEGIRAAFAGLIERSAPGDRVVVYYTGHGSQAPDDGRDEPDGLDELLVPYGATTAPEGYLRDDELGRVLDHLAARLGPDGHLLVVLDACHSGSATRGGDDPQALLGRPIAPGLVARGAEGGSGWDAAPAGGTPAPVVVLSAARHDESARWERRPEGTAGVLTLALVPALDAAAEDLSYRGLHARLTDALARMGQGQHPQLEGAVDLPVLGGVGAQQPFFPVALVRGNEAVVEGGRLAGLGPGAELELHPVGTRAADGTGPRGRVATVDDLRSVVPLDRPPGDGPHWALVRAFGAAEPLRVRVDPAAERLVPGLGARLGASEGLVVVDDGGDGAVVASGKGRDARIGLALADGGRLDGPPRDDPSAAFDGFVARIEGLARTRALRGLRLETEGYRLDLDPLVPARAGDGACRTDVAPQALAPDTAGHLVARVGDAFALDVRYDGPDAAWLSIVVFEPDGGAGVLFPEGGIRADAARIEPGTAFVFGVEQCLQFTTPGTYVVRGHATDPALDLGWLDEAQGAARGEHGDPAALVGATAALVVVVQ